MSVTAPWSLHYRPQTIDECILPARLKAELKAFVREGEITSLLFSGPPGTGKTTAAYALGNELGCDVLYINASKDNGVDTIRGKINDFASTMSIVSEAKHKIVLLDEADWLSAAAQPMLRGVFEEFWTNCRFIMTCNYRNKIIPALQSRCSVVDFSITGAEKTQMMGGFMGRVMNILKENEVTYDAKALAAFIQSKFPDFRSTLNELQRYSKSGAIDVGILRVTGDDLIQEIVGFLKDRNFKRMREWVEQNSAVDVNLLFDKLYDKLVDHIQPQSVPDLILALDEYQYKSVIVVNPRINLAACFTHLMANLQFK